MKNRAAYKYVLEGEEVKILFDAKGGNDKKILPKLRIVWEG